MKFDKFMEAISSKINTQNEKYGQIIKNHSLSIHNIKVQLSQLANVINIRTQGHLSRNKEVHPKEQMNAIIIRIDKELQGPKKVPLKVKDDKVKQKKKSEEAKENSKGKQVDV